MKTTILATNCVRHSRSALLLVSLLVGFFLVLPTAEAVLPAPDGGYPGANTAEGQSALSSLTTGVHNTALGFQTLFRNTTGNTNTASGSQALFNNTTGNRNTAAGYSALTSNTTGTDNTAIGFQTLNRNITGTANTAIGVQAMHDNDIGGRNTATGYQALFGNGAGLYNTAAGAGALYGNITGNNNTAVGESALSSNIIGNNNIALGSAAGNLISTGNFNIDIGNIGVGDDSNTIRIGDPAIQTATYIAGISGATVPSGVTVIVGNDGHLGTLVSSARFKDDIKPMDKASESILALKPVTFHYKKELDPKGPPQFGLVAEQVEKIDPHLVARDNEGKPYTVRYEAVNAMLLNEFLKEHRTVQELKSNAAEQEATIARQQKQIEALAVGLQKVSAQVELRLRVPQVVDNRQ